MDCRTHHHLAFPVHRLCGRRPMATSPCQRETRSSAAASVAQSAAPRPNTALAAPAAPKRTPPIVPPLPKIGAAARVVRAFSCQCAQAYATCHGNCPSILNSAYCARGYETEHRPKGHRLTPGTALDTRSVRRDRRADQREERQIRQQASPRMPSAQLFSSGCSSFARLASGAVCQSKTASEPVPACNPERTATLPQAQMPFVPPLNNMLPCWAPAAQRLRACSRLVSSARTIAYRTIPTTRKA